MTSKDPKQVFFHVSMVKTVFTFLQRNIFRQFRDILFIKKHDFKRHEKLISQSPKDKVLLSIELNLHVKGGFIKMETIAANYPGSQPIIVLRKQGSLLASKYKYYLRKHGTLPFANYYSPNQGEGVLTEEDMSFYPKIKMLEEYYGKRPLVLFQEELKKQPMQLIGFLAEYLGVDYDEKAIKIKTVKKSYSEKQLKRVLRHNRKHPFRGGPYKNEVHKFIYKKARAFWLHWVAYTAAWLPEINKGQDLLPKQIQDNVNQSFADDWQACIDYAKQDRELLLYPESLVRTGRIVHNQVSTPKTNEIPHYTNRIYRGCHFGILYHRKTPAILPQRT